MGSSVANTNTLSTNFNVDPYYDDFDETKNFHRILFRPGAAVQGRELTQMQTMLQNQIDRFGEKVFTEGAIVKGCEVNYDQQVGFVRIRDNNDSGASVNAAAFVGLDLTGATSGVKAYVVDAITGAEASALDTKTLYVKYTSASSNNTHKIFVGDGSNAGEKITAAYTNGTATTLTCNVVTQANATGYGARLTVGEGVIFAKDHFIRVPSQGVVVGKRSRFASVRVGFEIFENVVTSTTDTSLTDPASGTFNYTAPGANRLRLTPTLQTRNLRSSFGANTDFVEYLSIQRGALQLKHDGSNYNYIRDYVASRAKDNEGDYIVRGLGVRVREHLRSGNNSGVFTSALRGNNSLLAIGVEPGKAYVRGYDHAISATKFIEVPKGNSVESVDDYTLSTNYGNYLEVYGVNGGWDVNKHSIVSLRSNAANSYVAQSGTAGLGKVAGVQIGTARARALEYKSGQVGANSGLYNLYLYDIKMSSQNFANVRSVFLDNSGNSFANSTADAVLTNSTAQLKETGFTRGVFSIGSKGVKRLTDSSGTLDLDHIFLKRENIAISNGGIVTITAGASFGGQSWTHGTGTLSTSQIKDNYYLALNQYANTHTSAHTGTVAVNGRAVTGSGTDLDDEYNVGEYIRFGDVTNRILEISSATAMVVANTSAASVSGKKHHKVLPAGFNIDLTGTGAMGANAAASRLVGASSTTSLKIDLKEHFNTTGTVSATFTSKQKRTNGVKISKTINKNRYVRIKLSDATTGVDGPWGLGLADVHKITEVRKFSAIPAALTGGVDVTDNFVLDNGQRDNLYEHARLKKSPFRPITLLSTEFLLVKLDYFTHDTSAGIGFFSVDSYPVNDTNPSNTSIRTQEIPLYVSPTDGKVFDLKDSIDIRPRITDTANSVTSLTNISTNPADSTVITTISAGLHYSAPNASYTFDYEYYLGRVDLVIIDRNGKFRTVRGTPSTDPRAPASPSDGMVLARLNIPPFPSIPLSEGLKIQPRQRRDLSVITERVSHRGFKMSDIGVLEERISRLEYYTALSLLESETSGRFIGDSAGNNRFKNGIITDAFTGHGVGDPSHPDYRVSVDRKRQELRPPIKQDHLNFVYHSANSTNTQLKPRDARLACYISSIESNTNSTGNTFTAGETITGAGGTTAKLDYQVNNRLFVSDTSADFNLNERVTGGTSGSVAKIQSIQTPDDGKLITLKYKHFRVIQNPYATHTRNLAGLFYKWKGTLTLDPNTDSWKSQITKPDVGLSFQSGSTINNNDNYNEDDYDATEWENWLASIGADFPNMLDTGITAEEVKNAVIQAGLDAKNKNTPPPNVQNNPSEQPDHNTIHQTTPTVQRKMRQNVIKVKAVGMKPSTRLYAFFDGVNVSGYITPTNSNFVPSAGMGTVLNSDSSGNFYALFNLPNDDQLSFNLGSKSFRLTDSPRDIRALNNTTTSADATFYAAGSTRTESGTIESSRPPGTREDEVTREPRPSDENAPNVPDGTGETYVPAPTSENPDNDIPDAGNQPSPAGFGNAAEEVLGAEEIASMISTDPLVAQAYQDVTEALGSLATQGIFVPQNPGPKNVVVGGGASTQTHYENNLAADFAMFGGSCIIDPLAQTFSLMDAGIGSATASGGYLTKVDLYFQAKDRTLGVTVEIREVDKRTGAITPTIVPFSQVSMASADINIDSRGTFDLPTTFRFSTPVYLASQREYALVVRPDGNSPNYNIWCSRLGEEDLTASRTQKGNIGTKNRVTKQPAAGMLHASSNDRQYTPIQEEDLKFNLYIANFQANTTGVAVVKKSNTDFFVVENVGNNALGASNTAFFEKKGEVIHGPMRLTMTSTIKGRANNNGVETVTGGTSGAIGIVRHVGVYANTGTGTASANDIIIDSTKPGTEFVVGETVTLKFTATGVATGQTAVIHAKNFAYGKLDYYNRKTYANSYLYIANTTGITTKQAGSVANASHQFIPNSLITSRDYGYTANLVQRKELNQDAFYFHTDSVDLRETATQLKTKFGATSTTFDTSSKEFQFNQTQYNRNRKFILSKSQERESSLPPTAEAEIRLFSTNSRVSPAIDIQRTYMVNVENEVNADQTNEATVYIPGRVSSNTAGGSAKARYITKVIDLKDGQDAEDIKVILDAYTPPSSNVNVYYKVLNREDNETFGDRGYVLMNDVTSNVIVSSVDNRFDFKEREYDVPDFDDTYKNGANTTTGVLNYTNSSGVQFAGFKKFAIKIVLTATDTTNPPRVRNFRAIALQK